jgi:hypothetical protein
MSSKKIKVLNCATDKPLVKKKKTNIKRRPVQAKTAKGESKQE